MAVITSVCASWSDLDADLKAFRSELQNIETNVGKDVNAIINSPDEALIDAQVTTALNFVNDFFAQQPIGGLKKAMNDSNIQYVGDNAYKPLEDQGFLYANSRYWLCNSTNSEAPVRNQISYNYVGLGNGIKTPEEISVILGRTYVDPSEDVIASYLKQANTALNEPTPPDTSVTGCRTTYGNIAVLREYYRGCGSNLNTLSEFLKDSYSKGFGVIWSTSKVIVVYKPEALDNADFNASWVRTYLNQVVFDDDIEFVDTYCFVRIEEHLGYNIPRQSAQSLLDIKLKADSNQPSSQTLIARSVRFSVNEDVKNMSPIIVSRGCTPDKISNTSYTLGMSVNGIYRVIDISSDKGQRIVRTQYILQDIVDSIAEVFGDLVDCGIVGTEFFIKLKSGFGATGSITLFYTPEDCSEALGLHNSINESVYARSLVLESLFQETDLKTAGEVIWAGGSSQTSQTPSPFYITYLNAGNLSNDQKYALLTQGSYWDLIKQDIATNRSVLGSSCSTGDTVMQGQAVNALESALCFFDSNNFNYREYLTLLGSFSGSLHGILVNKLHIYSVDPYTSKSVVRDGLAVALNTIISGDGILANTGAWAKAYLPLDSNYAMSARLRLLYSIANQYAYMDQVVADQARQQLCAYAESVDVSNTALFSKTTASSTFNKIMDGMDALTNTMNAFTNDDLNRIIWNLLKTTPGIEELFNASSFVQSGLDFLGQEADAGIREIEDFVSDLMSSLGINTAKKKAIGALLAIKASLQTAQGIANKIKALYTATTNKIVTLSNFNLNMSGSLGFQSKYLSCYSTGNISAMPLLLLAKMLSVLNDLADKLNKRLEAMRKIAQYAIDSILCLLDKLVLGLTGTMSYETTMQVGIASMSFQCTSYVSLGAEFDPEVLQHIMDIRRQIDFLLASLKLQVVTFKKHSENLDASKSAFTKSLENTVEDLINRLKNCF